MSIAMSTWTDMAWKWDSKFVGLRVGFRFMLLHAMLLLPRNKFGIFSLFFFEVDLDFVCLMLDITIKLLPNLFFWDIMVSSGRDE